MNDTANIGEGQVFASLAVYKGAAVAVKHVKKAKEFQITKDRLVELKQVNI